MTAAELRLITASNIIKLRQSAGLTQAELGARLSYSDKSISKWERGEAIPDAYTLTVMASLFGVTVDHLLSSHDDWVSPEQEKRAEEPKYSASLLIILVLLSLWTAALTAFAVLWFFELVCWQIFAVTLPVSLLTLLIMECVLFKNRNPQYFIAAFVLSLFLMLFFLLPTERVWKLLPVSLPAVAIVFIACNLREKSIKRREKAPKTELYDS